MSKLTFGLLALSWLGMFYANTEPRENRYIGMVSATAAYAALLPRQAPVKLVDTKDCPPPPNGCGGTGKVRSGDGQGWTKCPKCKPASAAPLTPAAPQTAPMRLESAPPQGWPPRSAPPVSRCPGPNCVYQSFSIS